MYAWLWSHLPGPTPVRAGIAVALFLVVVAVLFLFVFPWLVPMLPLDEVTVESLGGPRGSMVDVVAS